jgi:hypothetical protein
MTVNGESRIEATRRRLQTVRIAIATAAVVAFGALVGFARASHPATGTPSSSDEQAQTSDDGQQSDEFGFGDGSIGPSFGGGSSLQTGLS